MHGTLGELYRFKFENFDLPSGPSKPRPHEYFSDALPIHELSYQEI